MSFWNPFSSDDDEPSPSVPEGPTCENGGNLGADDCYGFDEPKEDDDDDNDDDDNDDDDNDDNDDDDE